MTTLGQLNINERHGTPPLDELVLRLVQEGAPTDWDSALSFHITLRDMVERGARKGFVPMRYEARLLAQVDSVGAELHSGTSGNYLNAIRGLLGAWAEGIY